MFFQKLLEMAGENNKKDREAKSKKPDKFVSSMKNEDMNERSNLT